MSILSAVDCGTRKTHIGKEASHVLNNVDLSTSWIEIDVSDIVPNGTKSITAKIDLLKQGASGAIVVWTIDNTQTPSEAWNAGKGCLTTDRNGFPEVEIPINSDRKFWAAEYSAAWAADNVYIDISGYYI
jgi:hypothetical protein